MKLTVMTHLLFPKLWEIALSWFDFGVDLAGLSIDEEEILLDLTTGRD